jgi:hypothetical protein
MPETEDGMKNWETDWNRDVLERIVALLFALAGLADLAASAPFHRRRRVLGILSQGEADARAFLIGISTDAPAPADAPEQAGDAACLAARLRMLALLLCAMLAQPKLSALPGAAGPRAGRCKPAGQAGRLASSPAPDTS